MPKISQEEAKAVYEISKLTSTIKQVMDDFTSAAVMAMFKDYIMSYEQPEKALIQFMSEWEDNILSQKLEEIKSLTNQRDSMTNMVVGQKLSEQENIDEFSKEVSYVKKIIIDSMVESLME